jgi:hypothetical protein
MLAPHPPSSADRLLHQIRWPDRTSPTLDADADRAMADFLADLRALDQTHNRGKAIRPDLLAERAFARARPVTDERARISHCRYHLRLATEQLSLLDQEMRAPHQGALTQPTLEQFGRLITDTLFDLIDILPFLQRKVKGWHYLTGHKNFRVDSWEVFLLARGLAFQSTFTGSGPLFDHKAAQIASLFVLRQALELRFERLIAVYPINATEEGPRLRHGFHHAFLVAHPHFFETADGLNIKALFHLYDWLSEIVHKAYQPYAWQISFALQRAGELLHTCSVPAGQAWSIHNAVTIPDVSAMQAAFEEHFLATYDHGTWRMIRARPEAVVPGWDDQLGGISADYRPVMKQPRRWQRFCRWLERWGR